MDDMKCEQDCSHGKDRTLGSVEDECPSPEMITVKTEVQLDFAGESCSTSSGYHDQGEEYTQLQDERVKIEQHGNWDMLTIQEECFSAEPKTEDIRNEVKSEIPVEESISVQHNEQLTDFISSWKENGRMVYQCAVCIKIFSAYNLFKKHLEVHKRKRDFVCNVCDRTFSLKSSLKKHTVTHSRERNFSCQLCPYRSYCYTFLNNHMRRIHNNSGVKEHLDVHHMETTFLCSLCDNKSASRDDLVKHMLVHGIDSYFQCSYCSYKATVKDRLARHVAHVHNKGSSFPCFRCSFYAFSKITLREHIIAYHQDSIYPCSECSQKFVSEAELQTHLMKHSQNIRSSFSKNIKCYGSAKKLKNTSLVQKSDTELINEPKE